MMSGSGGLDNMGNGGLNSENGYARYAVVESGGFLARLSTS